jgi:putative ribosome biogenesis GTPase RsgA
MYSPCNSEASVQSAGRALIVGAKSDQQNGPAMAVGWCGRAMVLIMMGVSGSGKSTIVAALKFASERRPDRARRLRVISPNQRFAMREAGFE